MSLTGTFSPAGKGTKSAPETKVSGLPFRPTSGFSVGRWLNVVSSLRAPLRQPIPDRYAAANRDTSSKPPRFIRHWRRFGDFQKPWFLAAFFGYFLSLVKESNSPKAK